MLTHSMAEAMFNGIEDNERWPEGIKVPLRSMIMHHDQALYLVVAFLRE